MSRASPAKYDEHTLYSSYMPHDTRRKEGKTSRRAESPRADLSVHPSVPSLTAQQSAAPRTHLSPLDQNNTNSPGDDDSRSRELLKDVGSDSSVASTSSSIFSTTNCKMSYPGHSTSIHALTPLTSTDSSPPGKLPSPRSTKPSNETLHETGVSSHTSLLESHKDIAVTMTPVHTPPETKMPPRPTDGIMGKRLVYDPLLDPKLDSKTQKVSRKPVYKDIIEK